jgi:hypothetical protein
MTYSSLSHEHEKRVSIKVDEMSCKSLLMWIQSRHKFVGEVDFEEVDVDGDIDYVYNEMDDNEIDDDNENDEYILEEDANGDVDGGRISRGSFCQQDEDR